MNRKILQSLLFAAAFALPPVLWAAGGVTVHEPYVRAVPAGQSQTAAYMTLRNTGKKDVALVKAISAEAKTVELHTVVKEDGMMKMRPLPKIAIKAGAETGLHPGGPHVMLMGLKTSLKEGDKVALTLTFDDGSTVKVIAPVRGMAGDGMSHQHHGH